MDFHEQAVNEARCYGGTCKRLDELGLPPRRRAGRPGQLNTVRSIEDNRPSEIAHDDESSHIDDEVVIPKRRPALSQNNLVIACRRDFLRSVLHVLRSYELPLFDVDGFAGPPGSHKQICLSAQESRNLKYVHSLGGDFRVPRLMNVRENLVAFSPQSSKDTQALRKARPSIGRHTAAIRFIEGCLEDKIAGDSADLTSEPMNVLLTLNHTWACDQAERLAVPKLNRHASIRAYPLSVSARDI